MTGTHIQNTKIRRLRVALLDSGAGGLSIANEIISRPIDTDIIYIADKLHFPYGQCCDNKLIERLVQLVHFALEDFQVDIFIIACNTASTLALSELRSRFDTPFIGVVPAVKPAAERSKTGKLAILATEATVQRQYLFELIDTFAANKDITLYGSASLVEQAENYVLKKHVDEHKLSIEIRNVLTQGKIGAETSQIDQLILACTHFPILRKQIEGIAKKINPSVRIVDSTKAIVNRLESISPTINTSPESISIENRRTCTFVTTGPDRLKEYAEFLIKDTDVGELKFIENYLNNAI